MPPKDTTRWIRAGAIGFAVLAFAATAIEVGRDGGGSPGDTRHAVVPDPLAAELQRCSALTPTSARDEACERAWAESRRRFLGVPPGAASAHAVPSTPSASPETWP